MALFSKSSGEKKTAAKAPGKKTYARATAQKDGKAHEVLKAPWFSEKALLLTEKGAYTFDIPRTATKADVAGAIKEIYKVSPKAVRIVNLPAKSKSMRNRRGFGVRARRRKAYVYLHTGDTIQFA